MAMTSGQAFQELVGEDQEVQREVINVQAFMIELHARGIG
jgi:hypothetical protein